MTFKIKDTNAVPATNFTVQSDATVTLSDKPKEGIKFTLPLSGDWLSAIRLEIAPQAESQSPESGKVNLIPSFALSVKVTVASA